MNTFTYLLLIPSLHIFHPLPICLVLQLQRHLQLALHVLQYCRIVISQSLLKLLSATGFLLFPRFSQITH